MDLFTGIIGLIMLFIFIAMADNIGKIKKMLIIMGEDNSMNYSKIFRKGELKEYQGKQSEALDCYNEAFYYINKYKPVNKKDKEITEIKIMKIRDKILSLGGTVKEITK